MAAGETSRDLEALFKKTAPNGKKAPAQSTIYTKVREANGIAPPKTAPTTPLVAPPKPDPIPLDTRPMDPDDVSGTIAGLLRNQAQVVGRFLADDDHRGAQSATRTAVMAARELSKQQQKDDDGDVLRVRLAEITAAGVSARTKLKDLAARLAAEGSERADSMSIKAIDALMERS